MVIGLPSRSILLVYRMCHRFAVTVVTEFHSLQKNPTRRFVRTADGEDRVHRHLPLARQQLPACDWSIHHSGCGTSILIVTERLAVRHCRSALYGLVLYHVSSPALALGLEPDSNLLDQFGLRLGQSVEEDHGAEFHPDIVPIELRGSAAPVAVFGRGLCNCKVSDQSDT